MEKNDYFQLTENAKNYPVNPWCDSDDILVYAVPCDGGMAIMTMFDAMCFITNNDPSSMIALKLPKDIWEKELKEPKENEEFGVELKKEWFIDYRGENLI